MSNFKLFSIILGFSLCVLSSASELKDATKQKEIDSKFIIKWNEKFDNLNKRMEHMEANQLTGSSAIENNIAKLMDMVQQVSKKMDENSKKIKQESADELFSVYGSKCRSMCEVKGHSLINQTKAKLEDQLEQLETCLIEENQKNNFNTSTLNSVNVCSPNPCNGGQCMLNATGSGYSCTKCPLPTYGTHCQNLKCEKGSRCFRFKSKVYVVFETELNWTEADRKCVAEGMGLAMPKDQETNEFIRILLRALYENFLFNNNLYFWFGLKSNASGRDWRWTDGSPLGEYTGGRRDFKGPIGQRCGLLYYSNDNSVWFPNPCDHRRWPVCEKRISLTN